MGPEEDLYNALMNKEVALIQLLLGKHPELVNHEYKGEEGIAETPLLIACDMIRIGKVGKWKY